MIQLILYDGEIIVVKDDKHVGLTCVGSNGINIELLDILNKEFGIDTEEDYGEPDNKKL